MNTIKFSHEYYKLGDIGTRQPVTLLQVFNLDKSRMHPSFLEYDTIFFDHENRVVDRYELTSEKNMVLLFKDFRDKLFTTVRPWNHEKEVYYHSRMGEKFNIVFVEKRPKDFDIRQGSLGL